MCKTVCRRKIQSIRKEHLRYIRNPSQYDEPTGRHFNQNGHNITDFQCRVIYKFGGIPQRYDHRRIEKEEFLIDQLKTRNPLGINDRYGRRKVHT